MKQFAISLAVIALVAQTAQAGHLGLGGWGGPGLGGHHGGFGGDFFGGGLGGGLGGLDAERLQTRFENKFEDLQSDYDTGLADIEDFYNSDEYTDVVDGVEHLADRYDLFLTGVERTIDRLGDVIDIANDDLTFYDELVAKYEARDDLSEERLGRILDRLTNIQDHLSTKIDFLTEKQTTLSANLGTYQTFSGDLSTYLADIQTAGGLTDPASTDTSADTIAEIIAGESALRSVAAAAAVDETASPCDQPQMALSASAAAEPGTCALGVAALGLLALGRRTRGRAGIC